MANDYKITQKKQRTGRNPDDIKTAVLKVVNKERSVRQIALAMNLKETTLQRHVNDYKKLPDDRKKDVSCVSRYNTKQVFTAEQELSLNNHLTTSAKMHFGLTNSTLIFFLYVFSQLKFNSNVVKRRLFFCQNEKVQIIQRLPLLQY